MFYLLMCTRPNGTSQASQLPVNAPNLGFQLPKLPWGSTHPFVICWQLLIYRRQRRLTFPPRSFLFWTIWALWVMSSTSLTSTRSWKYLPKTATLWRHQYIPPVWTPATPENHKEKRRRLLQWSMQLRRRFYDL